MVKPQLSTYQVTEDNQIVQSSILTAGYSFAKHVLTSESLNDKGFLRNIIFSDGTVKL